MRKVLLIVLVLLFVGIIPASAQDAPLDDVDTIAITVQGLFALIGVALSVGVGGGVGGALLIIRALRNNEALTASIEKLAISSPPETIEIIRKLAELAIESGQFLRDVTDGKPNQPAE